MIPRKNVNLDIHRSILFFIIQLFLVKPICYGQTINRAPHFIPGGDMARFSLPEDAKVGFPVYHLQGIDPEGSEVHYSISGEYFTVNRNSGIVTLLKPLDRESVDLIEVIISITDEGIAGAEPNTVSLRREIPILDVNDNPPVFHGRPYAFTTDETTKLGTTLYSNISVTDADGGVNADISLTCMPEADEDNACSLFTVSSEKVREGSYVGIISLKRPLDYEQHSSYRLIIKATDMALDTSRRLTATANVIIDVKDVQDQPPKFLNAPYSATVPEGTVHNTKVLEVKARDGDLGNPNTVMLTLEGDYLGYFRLVPDDFTPDQNPLVTSAYIVTTHNALDREHPDIIQNGGIYTFYVKATELINNELPGDTAISTVTIVVTDVDDQIPVFSEQALNISVSEDIGTDISLPGLNLVAHDRDIGENARFTLKLRNVSNSAGMFSVHPEIATGRTPIVVKVTDSNGFDFDVDDSERRKIVFDVVASVIGKEGEEIEVSSTRITVNLVDANDNAPVFPMSSYHLQVKENVLPGTQISNLSATDIDSGEYGMIMYAVKGFGSEKFATDAHKGGLYISENSQGLDYETQKSFSLTFEARDGGGKVSTVNLLIEVEDVNDNKPVFEESEYSRTIREGATSFEPQFFVRATDADGPNQGGGKVFYSIVSSNAGDVLFVEPISGEITLNSPAHSSDTSHGQYEVVIRATDAGVPPLHNDINIYVRVGVPGNQRPIFRGNQEVRNKPPGYAVSLPENAPPGTNVITVVAMDPDGQDSLLQYFIASGAKDNFNIGRKSGIITVSSDAHLDRDIGGSHYDIIVHAVDSGQPIHETATTTVQVEITDINNKPPIFISGDPSAYTHHVSERAAIGDTVMFVKAYDPDQDALLRYSIVEPIRATDKTGNTVKSSTFDFKSLFKINSTTGEIKVARMLQHYTVAVVIFTVEVRDLNAKENVESQVARVEVTIYIQSYKDNHPTFTIPGWSPADAAIKLKVPEEQPSGSTLLILSAKDPTNNLPISNFKLVKRNSSQAENIVSVDESTGNLILKKRLDYETLPEKSISFQVEATSDDGLRTSEATVVLEVEDINDNTPEFSEKNYRAQVLESSSYPHTILTVLATDKDSNGSLGFGTVKYSLAGENADMFVINPESGEIKVAKNATLDRERKSVLKMFAVASDTPQGGANQRKASVMVTVDVLDVNDNAPQFSKQQYTAVIPENALVGQYVISMVALDPDEGAGGQVTYDFSNEGDANGLFSINHSSGNITTKKALTGKGRTEPYHMIVRAQDAGRPPLMSDVSLAIYVADVFTNDGVPVFIRPAVDEVAHVSENSSIGSPVFQVVASDPDDTNTPNGRLIFKFLNDGMDSMAFKIDSRSGLITTRQLLDREKKDKYTLLLIVQDEGNPPQQATRVLHVNITDIDDHKPHFKRRLDDEPVEFNILEEVEIGTKVGMVEATDDDIGVNGMIDYLITYGNEDGLFEIQRTDDNKGLIIVNKRIDREVNDEYLLTVKCFKKSLKPPSYRKTYDKQDPSERQVRITVQDIDDNKPTFLKENITIGVRLNVPIDTSLITLEANDVDVSAEPLNYKLVNATFFSLAPSVIDTVSVPTNNITVFQLNEETGELRTAGSMLGYVDGYFQLQIVANNTDITGREAYAIIKVFILRDRDLLKFVFGKPPTDVRKELTSFQKEVEKALVLPVTLNIYDTQFYSKEDGSLDFSSTSSCFQLVGKESYDLNDMESLMCDPRNSELSSIYKKYGVHSVERCAPVIAKAEASWIQLWVLSIAGFIGVAALVSGIVTCCLYSRYKHKAKHGLLQEGPAVPLSTIGYVTGNPSYVTGVTGSPSVLITSSAALSKVPQMYDWGVESSGIPAGHDNQSYQSFPQR